MDDDDDDNNDDDDDEYDALSHDFLSARVQSRFGPERALTSKRRRRARVQVMTSLRVRSLGFARAGP